MTCFLWRTTACFNHFFVVWRMCYNMWLNDAGMTFIYALLLFLMDMTCILWFNDFVFVEDSYHVSHFFHVWRMCCNMWLNGGWNDPHICFSTFVNGYDLHFMIEWLVFFGWRTATMLVISLVVWRMCYNMFGVGITFFK